MVKEKTGLPAEINEFGEKVYTLYTTDFHRAMVYQKVDGSGRVTVEEYTENGWLVIDEDEKLAQEMARFFVRECVLCGSEKIAKMLVKKLEGSKNER